MGQIVALLMLPVSLVSGLTPGQDRWLDAVQRERVTNTGAGSVELLRFDFLTPPA